MYQHVTGDCTSGISWFNDQSMNLKDTTFYECLVSVGSKNKQQNIEKSYLNCLKFYNGVGILFGKKEYDSM